MDDEVAAFAAPVGGLLVLVGGVVIGAVVAAVAVGVIILRVLRDVWEGRD